MSPSRSRLARLLDAALVFPPMPSGWRWLLWPPRVLLGLPSWPQDGGGLRRSLVFTARLVQGPTVRLTLLAGLALLVVRLVLSASLPPVEGTRPAEGLNTPVTIERDGQGIPTIKAADREGLAYGLGFVHAQDRFFQMDLQRRYAAGELSALMGPSTVEVDRQVRLHRFRHRARMRLVDCKGDDLRELQAYTRGVNAGLASLGSKPWEYHLLRTEAQPWQPEDSVLVVHTMYMMLQGNLAARKTAWSVIARTLPAEVAALFFSEGDEWDAPLEGPALSPPPLPGPAVFDLRKEADTIRRAPPDPAGKRLLEPASAGSNNWAVSGRLTPHGSALVANDMHLSITAPNIWYRAGLAWNDKSGQQRQAWGATLPGGHALVIGSNGHVAWGLTNSEADWADLVDIETSPGYPGHYRTPQGHEPFQMVTELIEVKGQQPVERLVKETRWGPVLDGHAQDARHPRALRWVAHDPEGVNWDFLRLSQARSVDEALDIATRCGTPHVNLVVGDRDGRIGWTLLGRLPRRVGIDGPLPVSFADGKHAWNGYRDPSETPRIVQPSSGRLWTANNRVLGGERLSVLGRLGYDRGARAQQVRNGLFALETAREADMLALQRDNGAFFLARWRALLLDVLDTPTARDDPRWTVLRQQAEQWGEKAAADSIGYRTVAEFRARVHRAVWGPLSARCRLDDPRFTVAHFANLEGPLWQIVQQRPAHLLPPDFATWDALLLDAADAIVKAQTGRQDGLTWGDLNRASFRHPLGPALEKAPLIGPWLARQIDMPADRLDGGWTDMPFVQGPVHGASQRMAVSPGREVEGYFHMPGGQSGHPLSPHYRDGHDAWLHGQRTPFLPGPPVHRLVLVPPG